MNRHKKVFEIVEAIYKGKETRPMGSWMWNNHVQWVASKTAELAQKYNAREEFAISGALLHDLADTIYERTHDNFDEWSEKKGYEVLKEAGFDDKESKEIMELVVGPHSCHPENIPSILEGRVLATADAMFHLQTSFFPVLCYANMPHKAESLDDWREWFSKKVERDYSSKIFFDDEKKEVEADYFALKRVFGNRSLGQI